MAACGLLHPTGQWRVGGRRETVRNDYYDVHRWKACWYELVLVGLFAGVLSALAQPAAPQRAVSPEIINSPLPLEKAADLLERRYAKPVTHEAPVWRWRGDMRSIGTDPAGRDLTVPNAHRFVMPPGLTPDKVPVLDAALVAKVVDSYHQQEPDQPRYRVAESSWGVHIIPAEARDAAGNFVPITALLDARIAIPPGTRTASEHVTAICQAVTAASGTTLISRNDWFDNRFAANGYRLPSIFEQTGKERPYMLFEWGTTGVVTARDALIDLLGHSSTTLTWRVNCPPGGETCAITFLPLQIGDERRMIEFDRCTNCQRIPKE
jgi:hypothetical protein